MSTPTLKELPAPALDKVGWPWTVETPEQSKRLPDGAEWPSISIITPSYNQCEFLEQTIRSVLLQGYPNLEYIVIDGGSTDDSVAIIKKYERWITRWVSEKDRGQSHALNKGLQCAIGSLFGWINSDDYYLPGSLAALAEIAHKTPDCVCWAGALEIVDREGRHSTLMPARVGAPRDFGNWFLDSHLGQQSCLFHAEKMRQVGGLNESLYYTMDVELFMKLAAVGSFETIDRTCGCFRVYQGNKTSEGYEGILLEMVVNNFKHGFRDIALQFLKRHIAHEKGLAVDNLADNQRLALIDRIPFRVVLWHFVQRMVGAARRRLPVGSLKTKCSAIKPSRSS